MSTRSHLVALVALVVIASCTLPASADIFPRVPPPPSVDAAPYHPTGPHPFIAGGVGLVSTESLTNAFFLGSWNLTGGVEIPAMRWLSVVPRLHLQSAKGGRNTGSIHWTRLGIDGRVSGTRGSYYEAGLGIGLLDSPVYDWVGVTEVRRRHVQRGTPFFQFVGGRRFSPDEGPSLITEVIIALANGYESPAGLELVLGISY